MSLIMKNEDIGPGVVIKRREWTEFEPLTTSVISDFVIDPTWTMSNFISYYDVLSQPGEGADGHQEALADGAVVISDYEWRGLDKDLVVGVWFPPIGALCFVDLRRLPSGPAPSGGCCWADKVTGIAGEGVIAAALLGAGARLLQDRYLHKKPKKSHYLFESDTKLPDAMWNPRNPEYDRIARGLATRKLRDERE